MRRTTALTPGEGLERLATYPHVVLTWVGDDGYPLSIAVVAAFEGDGLKASFETPAGVRVPLDREVSLTGSHIRPQPGYGYDERRHVTVWGPLTRAGDRLSLSAEAAWGWDEQEMGFFEYSERSVPQSRRYFDALSAERGTPVKPRLALRWLILRATRLPFLSATIVPVVLGILIAAASGFFEPLSAVLTVIGASFVHLGVNVANDVFDATQGADDVNVTPTKYSGGSRVIQYGLVSLPRMAVLSAACYVAAAAIGLVLLALRGSPALLVIGVLGFVLSIGYTAPPLKLVYRGIGEVAVAIGFGPLMLVGAYVVQSRGELSWEPLAASIPVALLVALILYVNEIPDRRADARAGKGTLPVRFSSRTVILGYDVTVAAAYIAVVVAVMVGLLPILAVAVLGTVLLAREVHRGLEANYDNPYGLMAIMATNIRVHLYVGGILILAYGAALIAAAFAPTLPVFLH
jgi:1,4-dihydroxy-2-naphthoate octaprenyltransferase